MSRRRKARTQPTPSVETTAAPPAVPHADDIRPPDSAFAGTIGTWLIAALLVCAALAAYHNSFDGVFLLDDNRQIANNPRIRSLWPLSATLAETGRPVSRLSLAINYAAGGLDVRGYHAFNLAVHIAAGLLLFGIVRRTLATGTRGARFRQSSLWIAAAVAALWLVHPLQTESVTYIIQRDESLMGMFYLLTLYCGMRACSSPYPGLWGMAAVAACGLGMGSKEVMVSAPVMMLLYDRVFVAPSFKEALHRRWGLYAGLAATWILLAALLVAQAQQGFVGVGDATEKLTSWQYALTQPGVILHYLRLTVWPHPLVLDYKWPTASSVATAAPATLVVLFLVAGTVLAFRRHAWVGFLGAWFFLILAPTSTIVPLPDAAFEHRMYLPLAAIAVLFAISMHEVVAYGVRRVGGGDAASHGLLAVLLMVAIAALAFTTVRRNEDYRSMIAMWSDVVAKRPENPRGHNNLGASLAMQGRTAEAIPHYEEALRRKPEYAEAHSNLGVALVERGRIDEGVAHYREAIRLLPDYADARNNLGAALIEKGAYDEAVSQIAEAIRQNPRYADAHYNLGIALDRSGRTAEAVVQFEEALRLKPDYVAAHLNLAAALTKVGRAPEAAAHYAEALRLKPDGATVHNSIGNALAAEGNLDGAVVEYAKALRADPNSVDAENNLGAALHRQGRVDEAIRHFSRAVELNRTDATAHNNLGAALGSQGKYDEAIAQFAEAVRLRPDFAAARDNLRKAEASRRPAAPAR